MQNRKRDTDVQNRLLDSVGEGEGGMFQDNSIETCILSRVKQITSPGGMHETSAWAWCTGKTQRNWVEREVGGGIGMGNTCKSMADSCQCMTKNTTIKKKKNKKKSPWCWERLKAGGEGEDRGWDGWMASPTQWTWAWQAPGDGERQGSLACCSPMGSQSRTRLTNWITTGKSCEVLKHVLFKPNKSIFPSFALLKISLVTPDCTSMHNQWAFNI